MGARDSRLSALSEKLTEQQTAVLVRLFRKRRLHGREQVAAVCYRIASRGLEFLLVRTHGGHWTFPKGGAEPGLTHAQAAALEAFEEAGVHGRIEQVSFARYIRKRGRTRHPAGTERIVNAHLCEVLRLGPPQEANRNPTWFSAEKAKRRLRQDRAPENAAELAAVVDHAVARIRRLQDATSGAADALQKVRAPEFKVAGTMPLRASVAFMRMIPGAVGWSLLNRRQHVGNVVEVHAISGNGMSFRLAIGAGCKWKYDPRRTTISRAAAGCYTRLREYNSLQTTFTNDPATFLPLPYLTN